MYFKIFLNIHKDTFHNTKFILPQNLDYLCKDSAHISPYNKTKVTWLSRTSLHCNLNNARYLNFESTFCVGRWIILQVLKDILPQNEKFQKWFFHAFRTSEILLFLAMF